MMKKKKKCEDTITDLFEYTTFFSTNYFNRACYVFTIRME